MKWQPIETCPRGEVLLYFPPHRPDPRGVFQLEAMIRVGFKGDAVRKASHWMQLPSPPEAA